MDDQVPNEVKWQLITNEMQMWRNTAYQLILRHKVNKKIGADPSVLKQIEDEMVKCEGALEVLQEELDTLQKEPKNEMASSSFKREILAEVRKGKERHE